MDRLRDRQGETPMSGKTERRLEGQRNEANGGANRRRDRRRQPWTGGAEDEMTILNIAVRRTLRSAHLNLICDSDRRTGETTSSWSSNSTISFARPDRDSIWYIWIMNIVSAPLFVRLRVWLIYIKIIYGTICWSLDTANMTHHHYPPRPPRPPLPLPLLLFLNCHYYRHDQKNTHRFDANEVESWFFVARLCRMRPICSPSPAGSSSEFLRFLCLRRSKRRTHFL